MRKLAYILLISLCFCIESAMAQTLTVEQRNAGVLSVSRREKDGVPSSRVIIQSPLKLSYKSNMDSKLDIAKGYNNGLNVDTLYFYVSDNNNKRLLTISSYGYPSEIVKLTLTPKSTDYYYVFDPNKGKSSSSTRSTTTYTAPKTTTPTPIRTTTTPRPVTVQPTPARSTSTSKASDVKQRHSMGIYEVGEYYEKDNDSGYIFEVSKKSNGKATSIKVATISTTRITCRQELTNAAKGKYASKKEIDAFFSHSHPVFKNLAQKILDAGGDIEYYVGTNPSTSFHYIIYNPINKSSYSNGNKATSVYSLRIKTIHL